MKTPLASRLHTVLAYMELGNEIKIDGYIYVLDLDNRLAIKGTSIDKGGETPIYLRAGDMPIDSFIAMIQKLDAEEVYEMKKSVINTTFREINQLEDRD